MSISSTGYNLEKQSTVDIITVDNEGDGDYTSIKEALNNSNPGDTIEVYSGTYPEDGIRIVKDNITLLGIAHELGEGNDSGKPFIRGNGTESVIQVEACHVIVSNFRIENPWSKPKFACGIYIKVDYYPFAPRNVTISDCIISNSPHAGIYMYEPYSENISIINNNISHCNDDGIEIHSQSCIITGNIVTDCGEIGILFGSRLRNVSGNRIRRCRIGIQPGGENNIVYGNDIESCDVGIQNAGWGSIITKNNFKNYSQIGFWFVGTFGERFIEGFKKSRWIGNYWDNRSGFGPKKILGIKVLGFRYLYFLIPWIDFDWNPASEPYDIGV
jgi:parallel beta-helix repeat protein